MEYTGITNATESEKGLLEYSILELLKENAELKHEVEELREYKKEQEEFMQNQLKRDREKVGEVLKFCLTGMK
jgi:hypothetical protein